MDRDMDRDRPTWGALSLFFYMGILLYVNRLLFAGAIRGAIRRRFAASPGGRNGIWRGSQAAAAKKWNAAFKGTYFA